MKVSLNWVREYTEIGIPEEELIAKVRQQIGEVEEVKKFAEKYKKVVVAQIKERKDHPEADRLAVYKIDIGEKEPVQVVARDLTLQPGEKTAYFPPGTTIPYNPKQEAQGDKVEKVSLRGVESIGMLASARELDISNNHEIVMRIETEASPGTPFTEVYNMDDTAIDIENKALANRPDLFGVLGIAREIAGIQGNQFKSPEWFTKPESAKPTEPETEELPLTVENNAGNLCPRYVGVVMKDIQIKPSPVWLQSLLAKSGIRSINNIVDITNYLMLLTAQPLHAFDYDKLVKKDPKSEKSAHIVVRNATVNEKVTTIDGKTHDLDDKILAICDSTNPVAIGGVMGGLDTEVDENTKNIIIECANFDMYNVRKTSMKLGLFTEGVTRYSKGQDPNQCMTVMYQTIKLVEQLAGGKLASKIHDDYQIPREPKQIKVNVDRLNKHLGVSLKTDEIQKILENVELYSKTSGKDDIIVDIPSYRQDLNIREDIHEEVGRLYGYNSIDITLPGRRINATEKNPNVELKRLLRSILTAAGANEILTYNFLSAELLKKYGQETVNAYHITNALSPDLEYMRISMLPSVVDKVSENHQSGYSKVALFEINRSHSKAEADDAGLPIERESLAMAVSIDDTTAKEQYSGSAYYMAKEYVESLMSELNAQQVEYELLADLDLNSLPLWVKDLLSMFDLNASALVSYKLEDKKEYLGVVGEFSPLAKSNANLPNYSAGFELSLKELHQLHRALPNYREPSRYPAIKQDLCYEVDNDVPYQHIASLIEGVLSKEGLLVSISPVDIYQSDKQKEAGKKQMTYSVKVQSGERTLSGDEVSELMERVSSVVAKDGGGELV